MADDQGWGDTGYNEHPTVHTPNLDEMSANAFRFDRFYAAAPICSPTRASVLTGRHPNRCGVLGHGHALRPEEITVAEILNKTGYGTGHFGKWHLGSVRADSTINPGASGFNHWISAPNYFDLDPILSVNGIAQQFIGESSDIVVNTAIDFMRKCLNQDKRFLAVVWFGSPHSPHIAEPADVNVYAEGKYQKYLAEITALDRAMGTLRKEIRTLDIETDTLLWFCSDNGGIDRRTSGGRGKKGSLYEGGIRVPALLEWPGVIEAPQSSSTPCTTSDIFPTILHVCGAQVPAGIPLDGVNLVPLLKRQSKSRSKPIGFWNYPAGGVAVYTDEIMKGMLESQRQKLPDTRESDEYYFFQQLKENYSVSDFRGHSAWLDWPWKLHRYAGLIRDRETPDSEIFVRRMKQFFTNHEVHFELFNLESDPFESDNVMGIHPELVQSMNRELEGWLREVASSLNRVDYPSIR